MTKRLRVLLCMPALAFALGGALTARVSAAELQVLAGGALVEPLTALATHFENETGHKLVFHYGATPQLVQLVTTGTNFDLGIVPVDVLQDTGARARFAPGASTDIARAGLAVAVRAGAAKPDISTAARLKQTLLAARSIASIPASATGTQLQRVYDRLGISDAMRARIKPQAVPADIVQAVIGGEAELGVFLLNVLQAPGLDVVGPFPPELQQEVVFTAALAAQTSHTEEARSFIAWLKTPAAAAILKAKGLTPGGRP